MASRTDCEGIIITGCGWVMGGRSGSSRTITRQEADALGTPQTNHPHRPVAECVLDACPHLPKEIKQDRGAWITAIAVDHALREAGRTAPNRVGERTGMVIGCSLAGQRGMIEFACAVREQTPRFVSPINFPQTVGNYIAGAIARAYDLRGPNLTVAGGAASSLDAIVEACGLLASGTADIMLAGTTEARSDALRQAFPDKPYGPFEGACWFVLERAADRPELPPRCTIRSWSQTPPSPDAPSMGVSLTGPFRLATICSRANATGASASSVAVEGSNEPAAHARERTISAGSIPDHVTSITVSESLTT